MSPYAAFVCMLLGALAMITTLIIRREINHKGAKAQKTQTIFVTETTWVDGVEV